MPEPDRDPRHGPLAGYRVLELGSLVAGPFCGRLLADFGAEVIKIEQIGGDPVRAMGKRANGKSLYAASIMRNKKLVALDLKSPRGQELVKKLVSNCDIVVENFRPGTLERWGLGYEDLKDVNPRIIMVRITGFGQDGPYSSRPGYGIIGEALSGLRGLTGDPDRPPSRAAIPLTDYIAGLYGAFGAAMAVAYRCATGNGQCIDTALYEAAFSFIEAEVPAYEQLGVVARRAGSRLPGHTPNNLYVTRDGEHIHIAAANQSLFQRLAALMERQDLLDDPRFSTAVARAENEDALDDVIGEWVGRHDIAEVERKLHEAEVTAARIYSVADIFADPHFQARRMLEQVADDELGRLTLAGVVPKLSVSPGRIEHSGGRIGRDTREVLTAFAGVSESEIAALEAQGFIRTSAAAQEASAQPA